MWSPRSWVPISTLMLTSSSFGLKFPVYRKKTEEDYRVHLRAFQGWVSGSQKANILVVVLMFGCVWYVVSELHLPFCLSSTSSIPVTQYLGPQVFSARWIQGSGVRRCFFKVGLAITHGPPGWKEGWGWFSQSKWGSEPSSSEVSLRAPHRFRLESSWGKPVGVWMWKF